MRALPLCGTQPGASPSFDVFVLIELLMVMAIFEVLIVVVIIIIIIIIISICDIIVADPITSCAVHAVDRTFARLLPAAAAAPSGVASYFGADSTLPCSI
jgi:phage shock protein PspC (stress-responsive transcriptional regulator)